MKNIWKNHKLAVITIVYIVAVLCVAYFLAIPFVSRIREKSDDIQRKIIDNEIKKTKLDKAGSIEKEYKDLKNRENAMAVILDPNDEVGLIKKLEGLASETGNDISLKVVDPATDKKDAKAGMATKDKKEKGIKESLTYNEYIMMEISLKGDFMSFLKFMHKLENSTYYINVILLNLKKTTETEDGLSLEQKSPQYGDIFAVQNVTTSQDKNKSSNAPQEKKEKEVLNSLIQVVIYTKK